MDQFKVVMKNMNGEPLMPGDDGFGDDDNMPPKIGTAHQASNVFHLRMPGTGLPMNKGATWSRMNSIFTLSKWCP